VKAQESALAGRGFKGDDAPIGGDLAGGEQGVKSHMGADVQDRHARSQVAAKEAALPDLVVPDAVVQPSPKLGVGKPPTNIGETNK